MGETAKVNKCCGSSCRSPSPSSTPSSPRADVVVLADHATATWWTYHYEQYLLPIHQEITSQVGGPIILPVCGNCSDRLELFARSGVDAYHFEWQVDSKEAVRRIGDRCPWSATSTILKRCCRHTETFINRHATPSSRCALIGPECAIPLSTPLANLRAIVEAVQAGY